MGVRKLWRRDEERAIDLSAYASMWSDTFLGYSPVPVGIANAVTNSACSACVDTLATSISALPLDGVRAQGKRRVPIEPGPQLIRQPSAIVEQDVWLYQLADSMLTDGNAFGQITTWSGTYPAGIELYDAAQITDRKYVDGKPSVLIDGERRFLYPHGDVWHVPGPFVRAGSPFGESPVTRARSTIGAAIAARDFGSRFFGDGGHPGAIISSKTPLTEDQARDVKRKVLNATKGNREPVVLQADIDYQQLSVNPDDSQFLELQRFTVEEACRFWRVPPAMVYAATSGQNVTYANVTQSDLAYLKHSLEGHLVRIEKALTRLMPRPQFARFNRNAFLRSDPTTRSEIVDRRLNNKTMTVNEARAHEDEEPFGPEYDEPGIPGSEPAPEDPDPEVDPDA